jgi:hypothetical protein
VGVRACVRACGLWRLFIITAMTSAAAPSARIPRQHSTDHDHSSAYTTNRPPPHSGPRFATSPLRAPATDVAATARSAFPSSSQELQRPPPTAADSNTAAAKVDSRSRPTATTVKSRAHTRLASLGRIASRGSAQSPLSHKQGETVAAEAPVSPSDTGSHKRSDTSTLSNSSSETTLSDDAKSEVKSIEERSTRPSFWLASNNVPADFAAERHPSTEQSERPTSYRPRMMHQTSSKLLRMTEDERPFTRVRIFIFYFSTPSHTPPLPNKVVL